MSKTGSDTWKTLLRRALRALDSVSSAGADVSDLRLGGGTVLALRYGHRHSRDIDLFSREAQLLTFLSPRLNDTTAELTEDYEESSSHLRLAFPEGEIDFIVAPDLLGLEGGSLDFEGRSVHLDASEEIVAKKLFYRSAGLKVRDVLDLAVVLEHEPRAAEVLAPILSGKAPQLLRRLDLLAVDFEGRVAREVNLLPAGAHLSGMALESARRFVESLSGPARG